MAGAGLNNAKEAPTDLAITFFGASLALVVPALATPTRFETQSSAEPKLWILSNPIYVTDGK